VERLRHQPGILLVQKKSGIGVHRPVAACEYQPARAVTDAREVHAALSRAAAEREVDERPAARKPLRPRMDGFFPRRIERRYLVRSAAFRADAIQTVTLSAREQNSRLGAPCQP